MDSNLQRPWLSVVIPVYNECKTIEEILVRVQAVDIEKEIVVVDDASTDGTGDLLQQISQSTQQSPAVFVLPSSGRRLRTDNIRILMQDKNRGKGAALRRGMNEANGQTILIQDADLEYDPRDWEVMYDLIAVRKVADVVYGSRFYGRPHRSLYFHHYLANRTISLLFNLLFNQTLSDIEVCYKMFSRAVSDELEITCNDFGCEIQISAQICQARKWRIYETGIHYFGRTYAEGKKINWKDGVKAFWYVLRFRIAK
jgi:glycosyltransferase involved in cell wall biosynthesis